MITETAKCRKTQSSWTATHEMKNQLCAVFTMFKVFRTCHNVPVRVPPAGDMVISEKLIGAYKSQIDSQKYEGLSTEACHKKEFLHK